MPAVTHEPELSATREFTIDTVAPAVTFTTLPASPTNRTSFPIEFSTSEPATVVCRRFAPGDEQGVVEPCAGWQANGLVDGEHRFEVTTTDPAGNARAVTERVTVDTTAPAPVEGGQDGVSRFTFAGEPGATFECRLEGPSLDTGFVACTSPKDYPNLAPGDYRFTLQTTDAAGNRASGTTTRSFTIARPPEAAPPEAAQPLPAPAPTPGVGERVVVRPVSGKVFVRRSGSAAFEELKASLAIPVGTEVDARKGRIRLTAEPAQGKQVQRADFYGGLFRVTQGADGFVHLTLTASWRRARSARPRRSRPASCGATARAASAPRASTARRPSGARSGSFRTPATGL
jgi:hypothetical protein